MLSGGVHNTDNSTYYLNSGYDYWLGTAAGFGMDVAVVSYVTSTGQIYDNFVNSDYGVRPSIALKAGFELTGNGNGSTTSPYIIK